MAPLLPLCLVRPGRGKGAAVDRHSTGSKKDSGKGLGGRGEGGGIQLMEHFYHNTGNTLFSDHTSAISDVN